MRWKKTEKSRGQIKCEGKKKQTGIFQETEWQKINIGDDKGKTNFQFTDQMVLESGYADSILTIQ